MRFVNTIATRHLDVEGRRAYRDAVRSPPTAGGLRWPRPNRPVQCRKSERSDFRHRLQLNRRPVPHTSFSGAGWTRTPKGRTMHGSSVPATGSFGCGVRSSCQTHAGTASLSLSMPPWHPAGAAAKPPRPARTTGPDDGERELSRGRGARAADAGCVPQARIVRCCSTTESEPPDGTHGNSLTTAVSQQEPHDGKGIDSGKSAANRRNPVLLRSHRQQLRPWPRSGRERRDSPADRQPVTAEDRALIRRDFTAIAAQPRAGCANRG